MDRVIIHVNMETLNPIEPFNKVKNPDTCWKKYFQLVWPLRK